ncbi:flagellar brake protein [Nitrosomonas sp.]|uniref:flagellar brake protein n=1 Tax=Nitrosomonas sp. TaxID=42353 RepID=UPI0025CE9960|nr:flagellar brake protein [Nitrosomonas sp.]MCC6916488.1 flagellar brake protein [Nitrosomonas sp.]
MVTPQTKTAIKAEWSGSSSAAGNMNVPDYNVNSLAEICFYLNGIMQEKSLISLQLARNSHSVILSSLLAVDPENKLLILDYGINETLNQMALKRGTLRCTTSHNRIRIEFDCDNLQHVRYEGRNAFSTTIPETLKRMQRRNFYRIATPLTNPAVCIIPSLEQDGETSLAFNLLDISCGGMALIDQPGAEISLKPGTLLERCQIDLPELGAFEATIRIVCVGTTILPNGDTCPRIGCEFIKLTEKSRMLIQRYITKLEQQARKYSTNSH